MSRPRDSKPAAGIPRQVMSRLRRRRYGDPVVPIVSLSGIMAFLLVALLAVPAAATAAAPETATLQDQEEGQESERPRVEMRRYPVRHTNMSAAYTLAEALCSEYRFNSALGSCTVEAMDEEGLVFIATPELHARLADLLAEIDMPPRSQRFHIVVLETVEGAGMPADDLHAGAVGALEDVLSFLPYTGFQILANGWLETSRQGQTSLSGPGNFELALMFRGDPRSGDTLMVEHFELSAVSLSPEEIRAKERAGEPLPRRVILESNFSIDVGETKVLGTSKLNGDGNALVVLLTAVE